MSFADLEAHPPAVAPRTAEPKVHVTVLRPTGRWQPLGFQELWRGRELLWTLASRDVSVRYKQTVLGAAWALLQPLLLMAIFTLVLGRVAKLPTGGFPYPLFVLAGLLPWMLFATAVTSSSASVVGAERLITKIYFPRLYVPLAACAPALADFAVGYTAFLVIMVAFYGIVPGIGAILALIPVAFMALAAIGVGSGLAALNVLYRDVKYTIPFLIQTWMFATPSIYMDLSAAGPSSVAGWLLRLNPLTGLVAATRAFALGGTVDWTSLALSAAAATLMFAIGCFGFRQIEPRFSDVI
jgi:lipopolysaccharide transport system permease protein